MSTPDYDKLRKVLQEAADLARRIATTADAVTLEVICKRLEAEKVTFKELRGPVDEAMNQVGKQREHTADCHWIISSIVFRSFTAMMQYDGKVLPMRVGPRRRQRRSAGPA